MKIEQLAEVDSQKQAATGVSQVQIFPVPGPGKLKAFARVMYHSMQLTGLRVYDGGHGLFVSYPNDPDSKEKDYRQLYYPTAKDVRDAIELAVLREYLNYLAQQEEEA